MDVPELLPIYSSPIETAQLYLSTGLTGCAPAKQNFDNCSHMCELNFMRTVKFYRLNTGKCPVEEFFESLTDKQFEKISFVLYLIEKIDIVPLKFFKKLKGTD